MAQEGTSLSSVEDNGDFTGSAVTPASPFTHASMVVTVADYDGSGNIQVVLQASHDGTNWATIGTTNYPNGPHFCSAIFPGVELRAVINSWDPGAIGSVSATVCGV